MKKKRHGERVTVGVIGGSGLYDIEGYDFEYTNDQKSWAYNQRHLARRGLGDVLDQLSPGRPLPERARAFKEWMQG